MRLIDVLVSTLGLLLLSPVFLLCALLIKLDSSGPVFYRARRVGQYGNLFYQYKFRSMVVNAEQAGPGITTAHDKRITKIGRFLRHYKLDELPQLINVLKGEMSLVGPRPETPHYVAHYTTTQRQILNTLPGITSPASLTYRHEQSLLVGDDWEKIYLREIMPQKLAIELEYLARRTLWQDLALIVRTLWAVFQ
jgi:lipopolysaccharide/colanic/teichoic acid biosynthesis glycosyltransferase